MARHSKWHNIQVRKGKQDKTRANAFTKACRAITMAARLGGGDEASNVALRVAIDKARTLNVPKDNIERAIKRGTGELGDQAALEEIVYEAFGPGGIALIIEAVTDNRNRTSAELKHLLATHDGSLGVPGSVQWQFVHQAGLEWIPKEPISVSVEVREKMDALYEALDALDDVRNVYTNERS